MSATRVIYYGTPAFAIPALEALARHYEVVAVVTQPDRPAGRGHKLSPPPIKTKAEELTIPVLQPESVRSITQENGTFSGNAQASTLVAFLNSTKTIDIGVCVAYGKILPQSLVHATTHPMINIHPSLLPRWRGAAPIQWTVFSGDKETGVAIMDVADELDTGDIYAMKKLPVAEVDTFGTLHDRLAQVGSDLLLEVIPQIINGSCKPIPQASSGATYAEKWEKEQMTICWQDPASVTIGRIKASDPLPGARTTYRGEQVKVFSASVVPNQDYHAAPAGCVVAVSRSELILSAGDQEYIRLEELQFPGKNRLPITEILRGRRISEGERFE